MTNSVFHGYSNKGHDGFLGNAVLGEWCNIGAGSNNSNLKNNYGKVSVWDYETEKDINTKAQFCGLVMGDHSKCAIDTMFNTGTTVGVFANIFGVGFPPKFIPSFTWGGVAASKAYHPGAAFKVAEKVMQRRNKTFTAQHQSVLQAIFDQTEIYRLNYMS